MFGGVFTPPGEVKLNEQGLPSEINGTTFIYEADTLQEAEALAHGDPFWASGEVVRHLASRIVLFADRG